VAFGAKVHLGSLLRLTNLRLDYLIMSTFLPAVEVGLYSAANSALIPISVVPVVAGTLLSPVIAAVREEGDSTEAGRRQVALIGAKATRYTFWALAGGGLICAASPIAVPVLLGRPYTDSVHLVWILTPGYVALCFNNIIAAGTAGMKRPWVGTVAEGVAVAVTLVLLPILLPRFGATGAAVASTAAYAVSAAAAGVGFVRLRRQFGDGQGPGAAAEDVAMSPQLPPSGLRANGL
jgi:O-antigen/teichoic acid export membrane protein